MVRHAAKLRMKTAIVHYWLIGMRGGERVVEELCRLLPDADVFTLFYDPDKVSDTIRSHKVHASFLNPLRRIHRRLLPLMPYALESFDLRGYDLILSSESGPAKGVIAPSTARHVCYCHTPMRYLWDLYPDYLHEWSGPLARFPLAYFAHHLRMWDYASAARVDEFVANSRNVQRRIRKVYGRDSRVVYPPVQVDRFRYEPPSDYFLMVGEMVAYKRMDVAVRVCTSIGAKLKVVGSGPEFAKLRAIAGPAVEFCGRVTDHELASLYARSRALLMPGEEDFGIAPVEALASGKPVVAWGKGGVLETVHPECGVLYKDPEEACLEEALRCFEEREANFQPSVLRQSAEVFSAESFRTEMRKVLDLT